MRNIIGVTDEASIADLKRWLLFVDELAVIHPAHEDWRFKEADPELAAAMNWLRDRGALRAIDNHLCTPMNIEAVKMIKDTVYVLTKDRSISIKLESPGVGKMQIRFGGRSDLKLKVSQILEALSDALCRMECATLRQTIGAEAISLREPSEHLYVQNGVTIEDQVQVVTIAAMPEPSESVSFEQILDFRADSEVQDKLFGLRRWMKEIGRTKKSVQEVSDELEWLLHEYERYMRIQRMKYKKNAVQTFITCAGEIAENVAKLRFGALSKMPFVLSERKIALLEEEMKAPGREVSFLSIARNTFRD